MIGMRLRCSYAFSTAIFTTTSTSSSEFSSSAASCSNSACKQDFTKIKKSYQADLLTKNQNTVGKVKFQKFSSAWHLHSPYKK